MGYKVGDEVFIKGEVVEVVSAVPYPTKVRLGKGGDAYLFSNDELCFADEIVKTYEIGLNDAWEFAKKIYDTTHADRNKIFGMDNSCNGIKNVFEMFTPQEALAKIEAYEKEKGIKVGDVVKTCDEDEFIFVVAYITIDMVYCGILEDGSWHSCRKVKKTGKHIDIESLLRQIGE